MLHRFSRILTRSARTAALLSLAGAGIASAQLRHYVAPEPYTSAAPAPVQQTPQDTSLLPFLKAHMPVQSNSNNGLQTMGTTYTTAPSFGGYVNAPSYDARTTASLAAASSNNGVTVELTADFDKDGKPDIAVFQQNGTLNIIMNDGNGGLKAPVSYLNPNFATGSINVAYAVDVNNDGNTDIVAFDYNNNTTITWINLGNGTFNAAVTTALDSTFGYPNMVYVKDVNGDGKADLIFANLKASSTTLATVTLEVQLGAGDGTFGTASAAKTQSFTIASTGIMPSVNGFAFADINGDGKQDIALVVDQRTSSTTGIWLVTTALGNGDGTFGTLGATSPFAVPLKSAGIRATVSYTSSNLAFADVNGDGKLDLVGDINGTMEVALSTGTNTWATPVTSPYTYIQGLSSTTLLDVNKDGKLDAVAAGGTLGVYLGKGDGTFAAPVQGGQYITDPISYNSLVTGDFNNDGVIDVAALGATYKQVSLFFGNGTSGFRGAQSITANGDPATLYSTFITSGKYTTGGLSSALLAYTGGSATVPVTMVSDGKGNFTSVQAMAAYPTDLQYWEPIHADFNGDGLEDLVYAGKKGEVYVALSKGDGTFGPATAIGIGTKACPVYYGAAGDVNGDGKIDLVIPYGGDIACYSSAGGASGYYVALGKGDGTFSAPTFTASGTQLYTVVLTDLNSDGKLDMVLNDVPFYYGTGYKVSTALGNGDGTFGAGATLLSNYLISNVAAGDLNNDGKTDIVLSSEEVQGLTTATGSLFLFTGNGDNTFNTPTQTAIGNWFYGLQLADVNNDGNLDVLATLYSLPAQPKNYYGFVTLLGYGNGQFAAPYNGLESLASSNPQAGNFVNDNAPDVITSTGYGPALFIGQGGSTLALTTSAPSITYGTAETLTATFTAASTGRPAATGLVSFYDGTTLLGTAALSSGVAKLTSTTLSTGSHTVKAVYAGDTSFNPSTSSTATITVAALTPGITLSSTPGTLTVTGGAQGVTTLALTSNAVFAGQVTFTCAGSLPANASCTVNPGTVTMSAGSTLNATLVIGTSGTHAALTHPNSPWEAPAAAVSLAGLAGLFLARRKRARLFAALSVLVLASAGMFITGCSDGGNDTKASALTAAPGTYSVTVTATPAAGTNATAQSTTVSVTIN